MKKVGSISYNYNIFEGKRIEKLSLIYYSKNLIIIVIVIIL